MLDQYRMSLLEYGFTKWQMRTLDPKIGRMIALLPIFVCIGVNENVDRSIQNARRIIFSHVRSRRVACLVFKYVAVKAKKYLDDQELFYEAKQKAYEFITQNIQMFALVLDALDGIDRELGRVSMIIKKSYEESFEMSEETKRLLRYQERRYFSDENVIE